MSARYQVEVTAIAEGQLGAAGRWWRANRPKSPGAIRQEFARAVQILEEQPHVGPGVRSSRVSDVRRINLRRIGY